MQEISFVDFKRPLDTDRLLRNDSVDKTVTPPKSLDADTSPTVAVSRTVIRLPMHAVFMASRSFIRSPVGGVPATALQVRPQSLQR